MGKKALINSLSPITAAMEPSEKHILQNYIRVLRRFRPLSETRKIKLLHKLTTAKARRRLIQHYLPLVLEMAFSEKRGDLKANIQAGNRALIEWFRKADCRPFDDVDYMIRHRVKDAFRALC